MTALQGLGEELVDLSRERLVELALPEALLEAVLDAQRIKSHEGRRRQMQFIGKLMRSVEVEPIQDQLAVWRGSSRAAAAALHHLEQWRDKLIASDEALTALAAVAPPIAPDTLKALRSSVRQARQEQATERPPRHYREIFRLLRVILAPPPVTP